MSHDRLRPSLMEKVAEGDRKNIALLLDMIYGDFMHKLNLTETQLKGRLSDHEAKLFKGEDRFKRLENCPCAVHRDPAHSCVILDVSAALADIKLELTKEVAKIRVRLAWWAGATSVLIGALHLMYYLWPWIKGYAR